MLFFGFSLALDFCKKMILDGGFYFRVLIFGFVTIYRKSFKNDSMMVRMLRRDGRGCCLGYRHKMWVRVCVSGMGGCDRMSILEFSLFMEPDSFGIYSFQSKIFRLKTGFIQKFGFMGVGKLCFKDKTAENIRFKNRVFQMFGFMGVGKLCFKDKTAENISFENGRRQE